MIAIIGVGSPFGFDRLGWEVVDFLRERAHAVPVLFNDVKLVQNDRLGAPLLAQMRGAELAIVVDAIEAGCESEVPIRLNLDALGPFEEGLCSHSFGLGQTLALGRTLGQLPERVVVIGMEARGRTERAPSESEIRRLSDAVEREIEQSRRTLGQPVEHSCI
jgi:hydrogenase maturation protease